MGSPSKNQNQENPPNPKNEPSSKTPAAPSPAVQKPSIFKSTTKSHGPKEAPPPSKTSSSFAPSTISSKATPAQSLTSDPEKPTHSAQTFRSACATFRMAGLSSVDSRVTMKTSRRTSP